MFFQFQNTAARLRLEKQKIKRSLNVVYVVNAVSAVTSDLVHSFLEVAKIIYKTPVMLTLSIKALYFYFLYILVCYVCYVCKDSQTTAYMKRVDTS